MDAIVKGGRMLAIRWHRQTASAAFYICLRWKGPKAVPIASKMYIRSENYRLQLESVG